MRPASWSSSLIAFCFPRWSTIRTCWVTSWLAFSWSRLPIITRKGCHSIVLASWRTSRGHVAVKNMLWRCCPMCCKILRICGSKPMSSMRSASSRTSLPTLSRWIWPPSRKSLSRPGQATMQWTPFLYFCIWSRFGQPPYMETVRMFRQRPNLLASSSVCCASSRVGDITSSPAPFCWQFQPLLKKSLKAGSRKARVLPLPVAAMPMTSRPCSASGQV
mmetsp:Transcript_37807/g.97781  ORF Transcript_37807/g.97781 Transcript_37807/m.97781 type:complete len:218 (-) Transcript_37807:533-1186(-)